MQTTLSTKQFKRLCATTGTPSPSGFERTVIEEVILPALGDLPSSWKVHRFVGNAGIVIDTAPGDENLLTIMLDAHVDKILLKVKSVSSAGIRVETSMGTAASFVGAPVSLVVPSSELAGNFQLLPGCTIEALGAAHHAKPDIKAGKVGVPVQDLYIETGAIGGNEQRTKWYQDAGITPGTPVILNSPLRRATFPGTFRGAYLDNSLGVLALIAFIRSLSSVFPRCPHVRFLISFSACEEIGKMGATIAAHLFEPDILVAVDVGHDTQDAPQLAKTHPTPIAMGKGPILTLGSIHHRGLADFVANLARANGVPFQIAQVEKRSGNNSMAGIDAGVDAASLPFGIPVRYMHTPNEMGCDADVINAIALLVKFGRAALDGALSREMLRASQPTIRLR